MLFIRKFEYLKYNNELLNALNEIYFIEFRFLLFDVY